MCVCVGIMSALLMEAHLAAAAAAAAATAAGDCDYFSGKIFIAKRKKHK